MATTPNQIISSGSTAVISSGEVAGNNTVLAGGSLSILSGGKLSGGAVQKGGTATLASGAIIIGQPTLSGSLTGGTSPAVFAYSRSGSVALPPMLRSKLRVAFMSVRAARRAIPRSSLAVQCSFMPQDLL